MKRMVLTVLFGLLAFGPLWASLNVRDFGAKGDGIADDTAALQRAADALAGKDAPRAGVCHSNAYEKYIDGPYRALVFPAGTYRVSGPVVFVGDVKLLGEGAAKVLNVTTDRETFYVRDNHKLVVEGLSFEGGSVQLRQWTRNRDVSYFKISNCSFSRAHDTAVVSVSYKWYRGERPKGNPSEENVLAVRQSDGSYSVAARGTLSDFTPHNNSTIILVENSRFTGNATAFWGFSDGITMRHCRFTAPAGAAAPQLRLGSGGRLGVEMYLRNLEFDFPGPCVRGRSAIAFEGGRLLLEDSRIVSAGDLVAVRSTSRVNEYHTASSLGLRDVTLDTGSAPVLSFKGPSFPNRIYTCGLRSTQADARKRIYAFDVEPDEAFMKSVPHRDPKDNYKNLTGVPTENCCIVVREDIDETKFDFVLPAALAPLAVAGPGKLKERFPKVDGARFDLKPSKGAVFRDESIGRNSRLQAGDDTEKVAALLRAAHRAGGGIVELPSRWIRVSRPLELPDGLLLTAKGCAAIESADRVGSMFLIPEGASVTLKGILCAGGGTAISTQANRGQLTLVDGGFADFKGPAIRVDSATPRGFKIRATGGNSYVAQLYRGNADAVFDVYWYECGKATPSAAETPRDFATIANLRGGSLALRDFLGVPVFFGNFTKADTRTDAFNANWVGDYRWIDNFADLFCQNVRFGGEYRGITPVYAHGESRTYIEGGVNETSLAVARPGGNCIVACDSENCAVTVIDVLAHTYKTAQLAKVKKDGSYRPLPSAHYSNNFPFRLNNDILYDVK